MSNATKANSKVSMTLIRERIAESSRNENHKKEQIIWFGDIGYRTVNQLSLWTQYITIGDSMLVGLTRYRMKG